MFELCSRPLENANANADVNANGEQHVSATFHRITRIAIALASLLAVTCQAFNLDRHQTIGPIAKGALQLVEALIVSASAFAIAANQQ